MQIMFSTLDRETVYLPIRLHLFLSSVKSLAQPCIKLQPPLSLSSLLHNNCCIYVQFRLGHRINLVTLFFLFCALLSNDPYCCFKQNLKMSNLPGIWEITADPISCPIKAIANKSNSAGSRQKENAFTKTVCKMSVKYVTIAPTQVLAQNAQHCDRDTAIVRQKWP